MAYLSHHTGSKCGVAIRCCNGTCAFFVLWFVVTRFLGSYHLFRYELPTILIDSEDTVVAVLNWRNSSLCVRRASCIHVVEAKQKLQHEF